MLYAVANEVEINQEDYNCRPDFAELEEDDDDDELDILWLMLMQLAHGRWKMEDDE